MFPKHVAFVGINGARPHFVKKRTFSYIKKMGPGTIYSLSKVTQIKASLSSPPERNHARSAFLTVFHHTAIAKLGTRKRGQATFSPSMSEQG